MDMCMLYHRIISVNICPTDVWHYVFADTHTRTRARPPANPHALVATHVRAYLVNQMVI
jgi:hypothetical protein